MSEESSCSYENYLKIKYHLLLPSECELLASVMSEFFNTFKRKPKKNAQSYTKLMSLFLANLYICSLKGKVLSIYRQFRGLILLNKRYHPSDLRGEITEDKVKNICKFLEDNGYVKIKDGLYNNGKDGEQYTFPIKTTKLIVTNKLSSLFIKEEIKVKNNINSEYVHLNHIDKQISLDKDGSLKHKKTKTKIDYIDNKVSIERREDLNTINKHNLNFSFTNDSGECVRPLLYSVYNTYDNVNKEEFNLNGRVYDYNSYQNSSKVIDDLGNSKRRALYINNELCNEIDFVGMHVNLIYNINNISLFSKKAYLIPGYSDKLRPLFKVLFNVMLNVKTDSFEEGKKITAAVMVKHIKNKISENENQSFVELLSNLEWDRIIDDMVEHHNTIKHEFFKGKGLELQNIDSKVMIKILTSLKKHNTTAYPIHDSIVTRIRDIDLAKEIMLNSYREVLIKLGVNKTVLDSTCKSSFLKVESLAIIDMKQLEMVKVA